MLTLNKHYSSKISLTKRPLLLNLFNCVIFIYLTDVFILRNMSALP